MPSVKRVCVIIKNSTELILNTYLSTQRTIKNKERNQTATLKVQRENSSKISLFPKVYMLCVPIMSLFNNSTAQKQQTRPILIALFKISVGLVKLRDRIKFERKMALKKVALSFQWKRTRAP